MTIGCFAVWTRLEPTLVRGLNIYNPSKPPLDRGGFVGREFENYRPT